MLLAPDVLSYAPHSRPPQNVLSKATRSLLPQSVLSTAPKGNREAASKQAALHYLYLCNNEKNSRQ